MKKLDRVLLVVLVLFALVFGVLPVLAQTPPPTPPQIIEEGSEIPVDLPVDRDGFDVLEFVTGALTGAVVALGAAFGLVGRLKNDRAALDAIEWLGKSIPADTLDKINELAKNLRDAGDVIDRVTDGKPNTAEASG